MQWTIDRASHSINFHENDAKQKNSMWRKKMNWIIYCFEHFLDNFNQSDEKLKERMLDIQHSIHDFSQEILTLIENTVQNAKKFEVNNSNDVVKVQTFLKKNKVVKHEIQNKWEFFEQNDLKKRISKLLDDLQETAKRQEWYSVVEKIQERFKDIYKGWWMDNYSKFIRINTCIICKKEPD